MTVDIHKYHVVGLGEELQFSKQARFYMGGVLEMPLHSPRWLYSLGREVVDAYNCGSIRRSYF